MTKQKKTKTNLLDTFRTDEKHYPRSLDDDLAPPWAWCDLKKYVEINLA